MKIVGIVAGTVFLKEPFFEKMEPKRVVTAFGEATVFLSDRIAYVPRHGTDNANYILPHRINHPANMQALKELGVTEVIAINSTGSLKNDLKPGMLIIPHDFIALSPTPTVFHNRSVHVAPALAENVRKRLLDAVKARGIRHFAPSGVYWQTTGPRFETKAEISLMSAYADIVGMTMASEAVTCCELGLSYGAICSVDNYAHGIGDDILSAEAVQEAARGNAQMISDIIGYLL